MTPIDLTFDDSELSFDGDDYNASGTLNLTPVDTEPPEPDPDPDPEPDPDPDPEPEPEPEPNPDPEPEPEPDPTPDPTGVSDRGGPDDLHPHRLTVRVGDTITVTNKGHGQLHDWSDGVLEAKAYAKTITALKPGTGKVWTYGDDKGEPKRWMIVTVLAADGKPKHYGAGDDETPEPEPEPEPDPTGVTDPGGPDDLHPHTITVRVGDTIAIGNKTGGQLRNWSDGVLAAKAYAKQAQAVQEGTGKIFMYAKNGNREMIVTVLPAQGAPKHWGGGEPPPDSDGGDDGDRDDGGDNSGGGDPIDPPETGTDPIKRVKVTNGTGDDAHVRAQIGGHTIAFDVPSGSRVRGQTDGGSWSQLTAYNDPDVGVSLENMLRTTQHDLEGHYTVKLGGETVLDRGLTINRHCGTRPQRNFAPKANVRRDLFRNYGDQAKDSSAPNQAFDNANPDDPTDVGKTHRSLDTTGERGSIGPTIDIDAAAMSKYDSGTLSDRDLEAVRSEADAVACWPIHVLDEATLLRLDTRKYPGATFLWAVDSDHNPIANLGSGAPVSMSQAMNHAPAFGLGGAAFFDTQFDRDNMARWALYVGCLWQNPSYRLRDGASFCQINHVSGRATGWGLRSAIDAAIANPDDGLMQTFVKDFGQSVLARYDDRDDTWLDSHVVYFKGRGIAPWQQAFMTWAFGHAAANGFSDYAKIVRKFGKFHVDAMLYKYPEFASVYDVIVKTRDGKKLHAWDAIIAETIQEGKHNLDEAVQHKPGTQAVQDAMHGNKGNYKPGDMSGYPASPTGYPAILGMALAGCVDAGVPDAQRAYARWQDRARCNFGWNPQYGVRPK